MHKIVRPLLVSVVMPVYNEEEFLMEAIQSILNQTFKQFEFIIVDDYSSDRTYSIMQEASLLDERIKILKNTSIKNNNSAANFGILHARGRYIARMDSDDIALPDRLQKQVDFLESNQEIGVCGTLYACYDRRMENCLTPRSNEPLYHEEIKITTQIFGWRGIIMHPTSMIRSDCFEHLYYKTDLPYGQDGNLWLRMLEAGVQFANIPEILLKRRLHSRQVTRQYENKHTIEQRARVEYYLQKMCKNDYSAELLNIHYRVFRAHLKSLDFIRGLFEYPNHFKCLVAFNQQQQQYDPDVFARVLRSLSPLQRLKERLERFR